MILLIVDLLDGLASGEKSAVGQRVRFLSLLFRESMRKVPSVDANRIPMPVAEGTIAAILLCHSF
jgi:hypothetical protein